MDRKIWVTPEWGQSSRKRFFSVILVKAGLLASPDDICVVAFILRVTVITNRYNLLLKRF
jgi:hypothetical protein